MHISSAPESTVGTRIKVTGEVDLQNSDALRQAGETALSEPRCRTLQVDLSAVTFLDSSGVGALVGLRNAALNKGGSLVLVSPQPPVRRVLELTTMDKVFDIHEE